MTRWAVAASGGGRSLANLLTSARDAGGYEIVAVVLSRPDCGAAGIAAAHNLPIFVGDFQTGCTAELTSFLQQRDVEWVCLAGFLKRFPILAQWKDCVINIHPALLPAYGGQGMFGQRVHEAVLAAQANESGASVHFVNDAYDEGALIAQSRVGITDCNDADAIASKVFAVECQLLPRVVAALSAGELPLPEGGVATYDFS